MLVVAPPKPVTVEQPEGTWPGWLSAWRRTDTGWRAYVQQREGRSDAQARDEAGDVALARGPDAG